MIRAFIDSRGSTRKTEDGVRVSQSVDRLCIKFRVGGRQISMAFADPVPAEEGMGQWYTYPLYDCPIIVQENDLIPEDSDDRRILEELRNHLNNLLG